MHISLSALPTGPGPLASLATTAPVDIDAGLALAVRLALAGSSTRDRWEALATLAAADLGVARAVEPHLDAAGIFAEAGLPVPDGAWGVFAAESGGAPLAATQTGSTWTLSGTKPWCSLADRLDGALITATDPAGSRRLFSVSLLHPGVSVDTAAWVGRGLTEIPSGPVTFDSVPAQPVGEPGWYLERPGFAWGGIGVAACWYGGAVGIGRTVHAAAQNRDDPFLYAHLGAIDALLQSCRRALDEAATLIDDGANIDPRMLAKRVRACVASAAEEVIQRSGHALGPAPLALDAAHAKRVADLQLYVRQHHAERDDASLGRAVAGVESPW